MAQRRAFGHPRTVAGKAVEADATLVPLNFLNHVLCRPIPVSTSGSSNIVFTVNASTTNPVYLWNGNDFISLKETKSYTWTTGAGNTIIATSGAVSASQVPGSTGVRYYYMGIDSSGNILLYPSTAAPSYVEGRFESGVLGHPGTSREQHWTYVGWNYMNATTPAFDEFTKDGYIYVMSTHAYAGVDTQPGAISMAVVPAIQGVRVGGYVTGGATSQSVELAVATDPTTTNAVLGAWKTMVGGASAAADGVAYAGFDGLPVDSNGNLVAHISATATTVKVNITKVEDVV